MTYRAIATAVSSDDEGALRLYSPGVEEQTIGSLQGVTRYFVHATEPARDEHATRMRAMGFVVRCDGPRTAGAGG